MERINHLENVPQSCQNSVVIIGNFDGVHKGHCALLDQGKKIAKELGCPCGVLTFEPHPRKLFRSDEPPGRITPVDLKAERLKQESMDFVVSVPFDWDFASRSYDDFISYVLKQCLQAQHVVVGYNFKFGQFRKGAPDDIRDAGIDVSVIEKIDHIDGHEISSSAARQALRHGKIDVANEILGWDWEIRGEVVKGDQRGRELGFPTANVHVNETIHPAYGVYAAHVNILGEDQWYNSAVNIGIRPMFEIPTAQVEAHILNFDRDIYGQILRIQLVKRLRGEAKFDSLDALIQQMNADCEKAETILSSS